MTAPALDPRAHMTALLAAVDAGLGEWSAFRYGALDNKTLPRMFALVALERRYVEPDRGGRVGRSGWRAQVRYVGTTAWEAEGLGFQVSAALDGIRLEIGDHVSTPLTFEPGSAVRPDDGRYSGESFHTYAI